MQRQEKRPVQWGVPELVHLKVRKIQVEATQPQGCILSQLLRQGIFILLEPIEPNIKMLNVIVEHICNRRFCDVFVVSFAGSLRFLPLYRHENVQILAVLPDDEHLAHQMDGLEPWQLARVLRGERIYELENPFRKTHLVVLLILESICWVVEDNFRRLNIALGGLWHYGFSVRIEGKNCLHREIASRIIKVHFLIYEETQD